MLETSAELEIVNVERSSEVNLEQPSNIYLISVTLLVSKFETLSSVKLEQLVNIPDIFVTLLVLKFERSSEVNLEQPSNICPIFVTLLVLKLLNVMLVADVVTYNDELLPNKLLLSAGA